VFVAVALVGVVVGYFWGVWSTVRGDGPGYATSGRQKRAEVSTLEFELLAWAEERARERDLAVEPEDLPEVYVSGAEFQVGPDQLVVDLQFGIEAGSGDRSWEEADKMQRGLVYADLCEQVVAGLSATVGVPPQNIAIDWECTAVDDAGVFGDGQLHWTRTAGPAGED
jgi:hypothetical protein